MEYILCAAIHFKMERIFPHQPWNIDSGVVIAGWRHHNCIVMRHSLRALYGEDFTYVQGFLTNTNRFVDREEAAKIATEAGQTKEGSALHIDGCLTSEDLY